MASGAVLVAVGAVLVAVGAVRAVGAGRASRAVVGAVLVAS